MNNYLIDNLSMLFAVAVTSLVYLCAINFSWRLSKKQRDSIQRKGLTHFTFKDQARVIANERTFKAKKSNKKIRCRKTVYFFENIEIPLNILKHNKINERDVKTTLLVLSETQVKSLRIRVYDKTIIHRGDFQMLPDNVFSIECFDIERLIKPRNSLRFRFIVLGIWASLLLCLISIALLVILSFF